MGTAGQKYLNNAVVYSTRCYFTLTLRLIDKSRPIHILCLDALGIDSIFWTKILEFKANRQPAKFNSLLIFPAIQYGSSDTKHTVLMHCYAHSTQS